MQLDVIAPAMRRIGAQRLLDSLAAQTRRPDCVTLISNELIPADLTWHGLAGRVLRFQSTHYAVGSCDVALRGNIGIFATRYSHILIAADDQVAPRTMVAAWADLLASRPFAWGHHRLYADDADVATLLDRPLMTGKSREAGVNCWHGYWSAYSGSFGAETAYLQRAGGLDMLFLGRHAGEDQNLGRRLARAHGDGERVYIHEPPAWWHPENPARDWPAPGRSNVCAGEHAWAGTPIAQGTIRRCQRCPLWIYDGDDPGVDRPLIPFDPSLVQVEELRA